MWHEGSRYHDTPTLFPLDEWSNPYDLAGFHGKENVRPYFCIKTQPGSSKFSLPWPKGEYCILKKGKCPSGKNRIRTTEPVLTFEMEGSYKGENLGGSTEAVKEVLLLKLIWLL